MADMHVIHPVFSARVANLILDIFKLRSSP